MKRRRDFYQEKSRFETDDSCQKRLPSDGAGRWMNGWGEELHEGGGVMAGQKHLPFFSPSSSFSSHSPSKTSTPLSLFTAKFPPDLTPDSPFSVSSSSSSSSSSSYSFPLQQSSTFQLPGGKGRPDIEHGENSRASVCPSRPPYKRAMRDRQTAGWTERQTGKRKFSPIFFKTSFPHLQLPNYLLLLPFQCVVNT